jgi:hypothetical protein
LYGFAERRDPVELKTEGGKMSIFSIFFILLSNLSISFAEFFAVLAQLFVMPV